MLTLFGTAMQRLRAGECLPRVIVRSGCVTVAVQSAKSDVRGIELEGGSRCTYTYTYKHPPGRHRRSSCMRAILTTTSRSEDCVCFAPVGGPPHCTDLVRGRRTGTLDDYRDFMRLIQDRRAAEGGADIG